MHHGEVQPERRLGEAWQLDAHHRPALRAAPGYRAGRLVGLKAVSPISQPKGWRLRRVLVGTPAPGHASVPRRLHATVTALASTAVDHDVHPSGPGEASLERRIDLGPVHPRDDHPAGALSSQGMARCRAPRLIRPREHGRRDRQDERLRGLLVLPFTLRLIGDLAVGGGRAAAFRTSSTTSCHQCSAGALSSPSSRWRVSANVGSWCHPSQSARVLHVPTITRASSLSTDRRSCPPTHPGRVLAADRRLRMTASQSRPAPGFRCTCVTIVFIEKPPSLP